MKLSVWLATRDRVAWITGAEILCLVLILLADSAAVRLVLGLPLLMHVGYRALTSLPMGQVPRRPERGQPRRKYDLRARVVRFLDEVKRIEDYTERAEVAGWTDPEVEQYLFAARNRILIAAREVVKATGRSEPVAHA